MKNFITLIRKITKLVIEIMFSIFDYRFDILILDSKPYSGSNSYAFYRYLKEIYPEIKVKLLREEKNPLKRIYFYKVSRYIITTHGVSCLIKRRNQKIIQFWHGIPLKAMNLMDKTEKNKKLGLKLWKNFDYIISPSQFYNTLLNACVGTSGDKYVVTGFPRTDYLFKKGKLNNIIDVKDKKVILFIPTFKKGYFGRDFNEGFERNNNIFGINTFDIRKFENFLKQNNLLLIAKLHPFEEIFYKKIYQKANLENFIFLSSDILFKNDIDLYEILPGSDLLITDYSSIYFDYLLLNKPIIFVNNDIEIYEKTRGFLLYPYDFWTPGPKVKTQEELQNEIIRNLKEDNYKDQRNLIKKIVFKFFDGNSCERIYNTIFKKQGDKDELDSKEKF